MLLPTCSKSLKDHNYKKWKSNDFRFIFTAVEYRIWLVCFQRFSSYVLNTFSILVCASLCFLCLFSVSENEPSEQKDRRPAPGPCLLEREVFSVGSHLLGLFTDKACRSCPGSPDVSCSAHRPLGLGESAQL